MVFCPVDRVYRLSFRVVRDLPCAAVRRAAFLKAYQCTISFREKESFRPTSESTWVPFASTPPTRALSIRNLVSGYECERVFPAGVGPGSSSRDAATWLPSGFSLSVEARRRYGWLRMVFPGARLFRAPIWCPSGGVATCER